MRIAVVTHAFPPSTHSNAKRPFYIVRALLDAGWEVDVFTSNLACNKGVAEVLEYPKLAINRVSDPVEDIRKKFARIGKLHRLVSMMFAGVLWPDQYSLWAKKVFRKVLSSDNYDRVLVFVFPPSAYLAGEKVAGNWTFDLQESVTPQFRKLQRRSPLQRMRLPKLERLERDALHAAGRVVFTANTNRQAYIAAGLVPETSTAHVPYFFDNAYFSTDAPVVGEKFEVHYFGTFDWRGSRSPKVFFRSLSAFLERNSNARQVTRFVFRGNWFPGHDELIDRYRLRDVVEVRSAVSYDDYLRLLRESPVLLLVVAPEHNLFMPSKIVDYFGAGRPILALVPDDSEMKSVLEEAGMGEYVAGHDDSDGCVKALESLWIQHQGGHLTHPKGNVEKWSSDVRLPAYVEMLKELQ